MKLWIASPDLLEILLRRGDYGPSHSPQAAQFASRPIAGGETLLERACRMARESTVFAEVGLADNLLPDRNAPLVNPLFPFLTPALFRMLHDAAQSGQWLRLVQPSRFHPVGSFVATQGRQDFSLTLDGPRWKELETLHVGSIMPLTPGGNSADSMVLVEADEQTCLWVRDEASFALATRLAENNAYDNFIEQQRLTSKLRWVRRRSP